MVTSLSAKGYIEKKPSDVDKRSVLLFPTEKAIQLVEDTYEGYFKTMSVLEDGMGETKFQEFMVLLETANDILLEVKNHGYPFIDALKKIRRR